MNLTDNERVLAALGYEAVMRGIQDGKSRTSPIKPISSARLMEVMQINVRAPEFLVYANFLRRIYGAAHHMQRKLERQPPQWRERAAPAVFQYEDDE